MDSATTKKVRGIGAEVRAGGFSWLAVVRHLGGGGTKYYKFNGRWILTVYDSIPRPVYRALRKKLRAAIEGSL